MFEFLLKYILNVEQVTYLIGSMLSLGACTWIFFGTNEGFKQWGIFVVSVIIGASNSIMLITSLGITNDLIGKNTVRFPLYISFHQSNNRNQFTGKRSIRIRCDEFCR